MVAMDIVVVIIVIVIIFIVVPVVMVIMVFIMVIRTLFDSSKKLCHIVGQLIEGSKKWIFFVERFLSGSFFLSTQKPTQGTSEALLLMIERRGP